MKKINIFLILIFMTTPLIVEGSSYETEHYQLQITKSLREEINHIVSIWDSPQNPLRVKVNFNKKYFQTAKEAPLVSPSYLPELSFIKSRNLPNDWKEFLVVEVISKYPLDILTENILQKEVLALLPELGSNLTIRSLKTSTTIQKVEIPIKEIIFILVIIGLILSFYKNYAFISLRLSKFKFNKVKDKLSIDGDLYASLQILKQALSTNSKIIESIIDPNISQDIKGLKALKPFLRIDFNLEDIIPQSLTSLSDLESETLSGGELNKWLLQITQRLEALQNSIGFQPALEEIDTNELISKLMILGTDKLVEVYEKIESEKRKQIFLNLLTPGHYLEVIKTIPSKNLLNNKFVDIKASEVDIHKINQVVSAIELSSTEKKAS